MAHSDPDGIPPWDHDEDLLAAVRSEGRAQVRVVRWPRVEVVLGRGSRVAVECHLPACQADGVPVLRRRGGGCAVVLDPGNLVVSAVLPAPGLGNVRALFDRLSAWVIAGLTEAGVTGVVRRDVCDLCVGDHKIGGAALYRAKGLVYYSTTLLVRPDLARLDWYLPHPPREPAYRQGRAHRDFVTTLRRTHGCRPKALAARLRHALRAPPGGSD
jgi:Lipoate-protein ligase A